jgi:hypothetical protein
MTTNKAQKRAVRARMTKTGESYAAARAQVAKPEPLPPRMAEPDVSEASIRRATGHGWDDWLRRLDERGTEGFSHRDAAAWLASSLGVPGWWAQTITVGYERARGLRRPHQTTSGFEVNVSKTFPVAVGPIWRAISDEAERSAWLGRDVLRGRTSHPPRHARFDFRDDGSRVLASLEAKGDSKSTLHVTHSRLAGPADVEPMRAFWRERLTELGRRL